jgi:hypothetical protein
MLSGANNRVASKAANNAVGYVMNVAGNTPL